MKFILHIFATLFLTCGLSALGFKETKKLAEGGDAEEQFNLGVMYENATGVPQDYKEAVKWYRRSAEQVCAEAQYALGVMYGAGWGVAEDSISAYAWIIVAKANGQKDVEPTLQFLNQRMSEEQIAEAQKLAKEIFKRTKANKQNYKKGRRVRNTSSPLDMKLSDEKKYYDMTGLITKLRGSIKSQYINLDLKLEGQSSDFEKVLEINGQQMRDKALAILEGYTYEDAQLEGFPARVRTDLKKGFSSILRKSIEGERDLIKQIYFTKFVVQ